MYTFNHPLTLPLSLHALKLGHTFDHPFASLPCTLNRLELTSFQVNNWTLPKPWSDLSAKEYITYSDYETLERQTHYVLTNHESGRAVHSVNDESKSLIQSFYKRKKIFVLRFFSFFFQKFVPIK
jgi:hypothetical protein